MYVRILRRKNRPDKGAKFGANRSLFSLFIPRIKGLPRIGKPGSESLRSGRSAESRRTSATSSCSSDDGSCGEEHRQEAGSPGFVACSSAVRIAKASSFDCPHISKDGGKLLQTAGRSGRPNKPHR
jgi:hypothetical protein